MFQYAVLRAKTLGIITGSVVIAGALLYFLTGPGRVTVKDGPGTVTDMLERISTSYGTDRLLRFSGMKQSFAQSVEDKIRAAFPEDPETAVAIAKAESRLKPEVVGDRHLAWEDGRNGMSCGVFQIRVFPNRPACEQLLDEDFNIEYARGLYERFGWYPWSTYKSGTYKKFLI
jgi:hypothetical protein